MHPLSLVATALEHHAARPGEMNAHIRAVELFLHDQREISDERLGFLWTKVLIIVGPLGAKKVGRPGILDEIIAGGAHKFQCWPVE